MRWDLIAFAAYWAFLAWLMFGRSRVASCVRNLLAYGRWEPEP